MKDEIHGRLRSILDAPDTGNGKVFIKQTLAAYEDKAGKAMGVLESGFDRCYRRLNAARALPKTAAHDNSVERLNEEVRRRERVIRIFPNRESVIRLIGALLMEQDEKWAAGKKYLDMTEYMEWRKDRPKSDAKVTRIM
ncbi:transposase [Paenibacillus larvae]|nr:transposase [Paenibacillus larvae]MDT2265456.1 transposase [Paenibacillus larvae]